MTVKAVSLATMLDVGRLRVLLAVQEHGGLGGAARALSTAPAEVSEQISGLERQLGVSLLDGEPPSSGLTPAGRRLAAHASRILADLEAAGADAAAVANRAAGVLRLAVGPSAGRALLPAALAALRSTAPELDLRIEQLPPDETLSVLASGGCDLALVSEYGLVPRRNEPNIERRDLLVEPLLIAVPGRHRVTGSSARLADFADDRWIVAGPLLTALQRGAGAAGFEPVVVGHPTDDGLALALVAAGHGIALLPALAATLPSVEGIRLLTPTDAGTNRTVSAMMRRSSSADPAIGRVLDGLLSAARRLADGVPGVRLAGPANPPGSAGSPSSTGALRAVAAPTLAPPSTHAPIGVPLSPPGDPLAGPAPYSTGVSLPNRRTRRPDDRNGYSGVLPPVSTGDLFRAAESRQGGLPDLPPRRQGPPNSQATGQSPTSQAVNGHAPTGQAPAPGDLPSRRPGTPSADSLLPFPTSPDLGVRSLSESELPVRAAVDRRPPAPASAPDLPPRPRAAAEAGGMSRRPLRASNGFPARNGSPEGPLGTLPPAPPGADDEVRLSIFEELQSEWFNRRTTLTDAPTPAWQSPADDGWKAAARLADPATAGTTTAGLPKRVPQALYVPGTVGVDAAAPAAMNGARNRSPQEVRGRLASYRDGVRRGRHAQRPGDDPEQH